MIGRESLEGKFGRIRELELENNHLQREIGQQRLIVSNLQNKEKFFEVRMAEMRREREKEAGNARNRALLEEEVRVKD